MAKHDFAKSLKVAGQVEVEGGQIERVIAAATVMFWQAVDGAASQALRLLALLGRVPVLARLER